MLRSFACKLDDDGIAPLGCTPLQMCSAGRAPTVARGLLISKSTGTKQPNAGGGNLRRRTIRIFIGLAGALGLALAGSQALLAGSISFASSTNGSDIYVVGSSPDFSSAANIPSFSGATAATAPYDGGGWLIPILGAAAIDLPDDQAGGWVETTFTLPSDFTNAS